MQVTDEWLMDIGFSQRGENELVIEIPNQWSDCVTYLKCGDRLNAADCPWEIETIYATGEPDRAMLISELPTQEEVLALCKVLRIPLTHERTLNVGKQEA